MLRVLGSHLCLRIALAAVSLCFMAATTGCPDTNEGSDLPDDVDGDGYDENSDCNDDDPAINPGADEVCDGEDNDCDGEVDEEANDASSFFEDADGDGFGDAGVSISTCTTPSGYVTDSTDCDDTDAAVHPGADEVCDGIDNDCDGTVDGPDSIDATTWYTDGDADGFGDDDLSQIECDQPSGTVDVGGDCDDNDATAYPGATELCDGADNDCDGTVDNDITFTDYWPDADGDGYGDVDGTLVNDCLEVSGYVANDSDCDDADAAVNPDATEMCDTIDNDCDGDVDEADAADAATWYLDADGDGYGDHPTSQVSCVEPTGYVAPGDDCDARAAAVNPAATEMCDGIDNDCDGDVDEADAADAGTWYADADGDGYGDDNTSTVACDQPSGYIAAGGDCDDGDAAVNPGATEMCDTIDNDCDGDVDEADAADATTWYADADGDGYGDAAAPTTSCDQPTGMVLDATDCDDTNPDANPGATEICVNGVDEDCDGVADNGCTIDHCGTISADETWTADFVHRVTCDLYVQGGAYPVLTIEDGAEVQFNAGAGLHIGWSNFGMLIVEGTSTGVLFTSAIGSPQPGDWDGIAIGFNDRGSELTGATVEYGGNNGLGNIYVYYAEPVLTDCVSRYSSYSGLYGQNAFPLITGSTFEDNDDHGVNLDSSSGLDRTGSPSFVDNVMTGNGDYPMVVPAAYANELDASSTFTGNGTDWVYLRADTIEENATWQNLGVPYYGSGDIYVQHGTNAPHLIIEDGTDTVWAAAAGLLVAWNNYGSIETQGTSTGVTFSASMSVPSPGDWDGLYIGYYDRGSELTGTTVEYGGNNGLGNIYVYFAEPVLTDCVSRYSSYSGLYGQNAFPLITGSTFEDNDDHGVNLDSSSGLDRTGSPSFTNNVMTGNGDYPAVVPANYAGELDSSSTFAGNGTDWIYLRADTVTEDATWQAQDAPYYGSGDIYIQDGAAPHVIVEDGFESHWAASAGLLVAWNNYGSIEVQGDTTGVLFSAAASSPSPGDWDGLYIGYYDRGSSLTGATVEYAGNNGVGNVYTYFADPVLVDCTLQYSSYSGLYAQNAFPSVSGSDLSYNNDHGLNLDGNSGLTRGIAPGYTDNVMTGNGDYPAVLPADYVGELDASSTFTGNGDDYVYIRSDTVSVDATWQDLDAPYYVSADVYIQDGGSPHVIIDDGGEFYFQAGAGLYVAWNNYGSIDINGTGLGVLFTSSFNSPQPGDWDGLGVGYYDGGSSLTGLTVEYGGNNGVGNVHFYFSNAATGIYDSTITDSSHWGIYRQSATPTISNITYADNNDGDLY